MPDGNVVPGIKNKVAVVGEIKSGDGKAGGVSRPDNGGVGVGEDEVAVGGESESGVFVDGTGAVG